MRSGCCWPLAAPSPLALLLPLDANDSISVCKHTDEAGFDCAARRGCDCGCERGAAAKKTTPKKRTPTLGSACASRAAPPLEACCALFSVARSRVGGAASRSVFLAAGRSSVGRSVGRAAGPASARTRAAGRRSQWMRSAAAAGRICSPSARLSHGLEPLNQRLAGWLPARLENKEISGQTSSPRRRRRLKRQRPRLSRGSRAASWPPLMATNDCRRRLSASSAGAHWPPLWLGLLFALLGPSPAGSGRLLIIMGAHTICLLLPPPPLLLLLGASNSSPQAARWPQAAASIWPIAIHAEHAEFLLSWLARIESSTGQRR